MESKISSSDIKECLKKGINFLSQILDKSVNTKGREVFLEAIEIGIENSIAALYDANVPDKEIIRVVNEYWGISIGEIEERLIWEKGEAPSRTLKQYLELQGYSKKEISQLFKDNMVKIKIRREKELWKLKNNPEKLLQILQNNNK